MNNPMVAKLTPERQSFDRLQPQPTKRAVFPEPYLLRPLDKKLPVTFTGHQNIGAPLSRRESPTGITGKPATGAQPVPQATDAVMAQPQHKHR